MEKQSLLNYRDSLIAQGVLYMVIINESKENSKYAVAEVSIIVRLHHSSCTQKLIY